MNIASLFTAYRLLEARIAALTAELDEERREKRALLDKLLIKAGHTPIFMPPAPAPPPVIRPPIGITEKRARMAQVPESSIKSDEEIVEAARRAHLNG